VLRGEIGDGLAVAHGKAVQGHHETADARQLEPLGGDLRSEHGDTGDVASGTGQVGDEAGPHRIAMGDHDDRNGAGGVAGGPDGRGAAGHDHVDARPDQLASQLGEPLVLTRRYPGLERDVPPLEVPQLLQPLDWAFWIQRECRGDQKADARDPGRRLRRGRGGRPRRKDGESGESSADDSRRPQEGSG
jgi:hypothetical protein